MLKGSREAVLHKLQPISIHRQISYDVQYITRFQTNLKVRSAWRVWVLRLWIRAFSRATESLWIFSSAVVTAVRRP